jgi:hypothetical protein
MRSAIYAVIATGMLALSGCYTLEGSGDEQADVNTDGRVIGSVNGIVRDEVTQIPIAGVTVTWARFNQLMSATTDADGVFTLTGLSQGDYDLVFRAPSAEEPDLSYADAKMRLTIPSLEAIGIVDRPTDVPFEHAVDAIVPLYPLTAGLEGVVIATLESPGFGDPKTGVLAAGASLLVDVLPGVSDYWVISDQVALSAGADGSFSVSGLPATPTASITVLPFADGEYQYSGQNAVVALSPGGQTVLDDIYLYNSASPPVIVADNFIDSEDFLVSDVLTMEFSKLFDESSVALELWGPQNEVGTTWSWSGASVSVTPDQALQPGAGYVLIFQATTVDGYDYQGSFPFDTEAGIEILTTNLWDLTGQPVDDYDITADLTLGFSRNVDTASADTSFTLTEEGYEVYSTLSVTGADATLEPMFDLEPNTEYTLSYTVASDLLNDLLVGDITFRTESDAVLPGGVSGFELVSPITLDYDTTTVTLRWDSTAGAEEYHLYARDSYLNTSEVLIDTVLHRDHWSYHEVTVSLPSQFDVFQSDGIQTPLTGGTEIALNIAAANSLGEGSLLAPSKEVDLEDEVRPEVAFFSVNGSVDNTAGTAPMEVVLQFTATEYIESIQAQYNPVNCFSCSVLSADVSKNGNGGEITIAIGVGDELKDDQVIVGFDDTSGNAALAETYTF